MSLSRSVYLARLRRAFLLRVHPDRFRNHSSTIRSNQATLVKALHDRLSQSDFAAWQQHSSDSDLLHNAASGKTDTYSYIVERRDGSFLRQSIRLSDSVVNVLESMSNTLKQSGAASLPPPPALENEFVREKIKRVARKRSENDHNMMASSSSSSSSSQVDHSFDIMSRQGRDLYNFLSNICHSEIQNRKIHRTDAQAAALQVRRVFQFQAVDATSLGWSSASVVVLLNRLLALHEEHSSKFNVSSFYPIRLVFTSDDFHHALDVYGGLLRLNPASTPLQWLEKLQLVTPEKLNLIRDNRAALIEKTKTVQSTLGVKLKKGFSCSNQEYIAFLEHLCPQSQSTTVQEDNASLLVETTTNTSLVLEPMTATVESSQACRRPIVTRDGSIRLGAGMLEDEVRIAVSRLSGQAKEQSKVYRKEKAHCKEAVNQIQWELGLEKVYRTGIVNNADFVGCLSRLLLSEAKQKNQLKARLTGNSLGIASSGHFCHLADDGSVVIPHDWR